MNTLELLFNLSFEKGGGIQEVFFLSKRFSLIHEWKERKKPRQALDSEKSKGFNKSLTSQSMPKTLKLQFSGLKTQCLKITEKV